MKTFVLLAAAVLAGTSAFATPACSANMNLATILATPGFTCDVGNLQFSNFGYSYSAMPPGDAILASGISVSPDGTDDGLTFSGGWSVTTTNPGNTTSVQDSTIYFTVTGINGALIEDLGLGFNGNYAGNGKSSVTEDYCVGQTTQCNSGPDIGVTNPPPQNSNDVTFSPVSSVSVSKDINVASGTDFYDAETRSWEPSAANISDVTNSFSTVSAPEPATLAIMGFGLLGLGLIRRRRQN